VGMARNKAIEPRIGVNHPVLKSGACRKGRECAITLISTFGTLTGPGNLKAGFQTPPLVGRHCGVCVMDTLDSMFHTYIIPHFQNRRRRFLPVLKDGVSAL
jgi:hypothetical protein